jgi:hypothetical protein
MRRGPQPIELLLGDMFGILILAKKRKYGPIYITKMMFDISID